MIGMAREAAVTFDKPFYPPVIKETGNDEDVNNYVSVEVQDTDLCKRYCARVVKNLKIGDTVDMEGFLYWYEGVNPHITSVTVK